MTGNTKPEALRIADEFKLCSEYDSIPSIIDIEKAEAEIRRLHTENVTLQQGYDAARLEIDSLQARVQELGAMLRKNLSKRIVELEAQLEAIGAGGVEPLRPRKCLHQIAEPVPRRTDWLEHLGFELVERDGVWLVVDDCGHEREATLTERVLWDALMQADAAAPSSAPARDLNGAALASARHLLEADPKAHAATVIQMLDAMAQQEAPAAVAVPSKAVAYLDIGSGGYLDIGTDLDDEELLKLPSGRHMLAIVGTFGVDGYTPAAAPTTQAAPQPAPIFGDEDHVLVPRGLLGAACSAIDKKRDGVKILAELRRYTTGDLSKAAPQQESQEPCQTCAALARTVMLDQVSFDRKPDCYGIRQVTDDDGVEEWADIRTSPDVAREEANDMMATGRGEIYEVVPLYTAPQAAPAAQGDAEDAARWRETLMHVGAAYHLGGQHFTLNTLRITDQMFLLRGSVAQHFAKCIDASRAARSQAKEGA